MPELKSYTCAKCGAVLSVDKMRGQLACPFCGAEFVYADFHREDIIRQAEESLARGAYVPAREKFNKVLESNPKDIEAIRGLILCAGKVHSDNDLNDPYNLIRADLDAIKGIAASAKEKVTEEEAGYLDELVSLFELSTERTGLKERKKEAVELERKRHVQAENQDRRTGCLVQLTFGTLFLLFTLFGPLIFSEGDSKLQTLYFLCIPVGICIIGAYIFLFMKLANGEEPVRIRNSSKSLLRKMTDIDEQYSEVLSKVRKYEASFNKKSEKKVIRHEEKKPDPSEDVTGQVICAKCGGLLNLNTDKELYECSSCGVSYGKYLFFGDLMANAVKAMEMGEFDEADQILSHKLTVSPDDFEALFGRFLCAGKWKSLKDIDLNDRLLNSRVRKLRDQMDSIEKSISKDDYPLWEEVRKLSDLLAEYGARRHELDKVREKHKNVCGKIKNTYLTGSETEEYNKLKDELSEKKAAFESECTKIRFRIDETVKVLEDSDSNCVFFRRGTEIR